MSKGYLISAQDVIDNLVNINQIVFEVTDACNLKCKYCAFGEFYELDQPRENRSLQPNKAIKLIDYMAEFWSKYQPESYHLLFIFIAQYLHSSF